MIMTIKRQAISKNKSATKKVGTKRKSVTKKKTPSRSFQVDGGKSLGKNTTKKKKVKPSRRVVTGEIGTKHKMKKVGTKRISRRETAGSTRAIIIINNKTSKVSKSALVKIRKIISEDRKT